MNRFSINSLSVYEAICLLSQNIETVDMSGIYVDLCCDPVEKLLSYYGGEEELYKRFPETIDNLIKVRSLQRIIQKKRNKKIKKAIKRQKVFFIQESEKPLDKKQQIYVRFRGYEYVKEIRFRPLSPYEESNGSISTKLEVKMSGGDDWFSLDTLSKVKEWKSCKNGHTLRIDDESLLKSIRLAKIQN